MDVQDARRKALRDYIDQHFDTSVNAFGKALDRAPSFFNEVLRRKRAFREALAEELEREIAERRLPKIHLVRPKIEGDSQGTAVVVSLPQPWPFSFARERFERLTELQRARLDGYLTGMIAMIESDPKSKRTRAKTTPPR